LRPSITQPSPSGVARVRIMEASEPAPGSERPKHMPARPDISGSSISSRARSVTFSSNRLGPKAQ
jgi:hypothetical protein